MLFAARGVIRNNNKEKIRQETHEASQLNVSAAVTAAWRGPPAVAC